MSEWAEGEDDPESYEIPNQYGTHQTAWISARSQNFSSRRKRLACKEHDLISFNAFAAHSSYDSCLSPMRLRDGASWHTTCLDVSRRRKHGAEVKKL